MAKLTPTEAQRLNLAATIVAGILAAQAHPNANSVDCVDEDNVAQDALRFADALIRHVQEDN